MTHYSLVLLSLLAPATTSSLRSSQDSKFELRRRRYGRCVALSPGPTRVACLSRSDPRLLDWPAGLEVEWRLPIGCDFSGFFVEVALGYVPDLLEAGIPVRLLQHRCPDAFLDGMLTPREARAYRIAQREDDARTPAMSARSIAIEHAEPCKMRRFTRAPRRLISRTMSEGLLDAQQVACLNGAADEVWLPTWRHATLFRRSGMSADVRAVVIPESADVAFFDRSEEMLLACGGGGDGANGSDGSACVWALRSISNANGTAEASFPFSRPLLDRRVVFLSVFKWEWRKGWDVLISAYWDEFNINDDDVVLVLKTFKPHWEPGPADVEDWIADLALKRDKKRAALPRIVVVQRDLSRREMRRLYAAADAFVLPTRGEGWGLPAFEAMTMALPTIVTDCAGPSAFTSKRTAFPLRVASTHANGKAEPSKGHLQALMRRVYACVDSQRRESAKRGTGRPGQRRRSRRGGGGGTGPAAVCVETAIKAERAHWRIREHFHPRTVASTIVARLRAIAREASANI